MNNVRATCTDRKLVITVDLTQPGEVSKTGKSILIASSHGFEPVGTQGVKFSINVIVGKDNGHG